MARSPGAGWLSCRRRWHCFWRAGGELRAFPAHSPSLCTALPGNHGHRPCPGWEPAAWREGGLGRWPVVLGRPRMECGPFRPHGSAPWAPEGLRSLTARKLQVRNDARTRRPCRAEAELSRGQGARGAFLTSHQGGRTASLPRQFPHPSVPFDAASGSGRIMGDKLF